MSVSFRVKKRILALLCALLASPAAAQTIPSGPWGSINYWGVGGLSQVLNPGLAGQCLTTQGVGSAPVWVNCQVSSMSLLPSINTNQFYGNVSGNFAPPVGVDVNTILNTVGYDIARPPAVESILYKSNVGPSFNWQTLPPGTTGQILTSGGPTNPPFWSPSSTQSDLATICTTVGAILYFDTPTNLWKCLAPGTSGQLLQTGGAGANPSWLTVTLATLGGVPSTRNVNTTAPLAGGGALSSDLTLTCATCATTTNGGALTANSPLAISVGGNITITNPLPVVNGGTNCASASGTCLDNITGFSSTGYAKRTGAGAYAFNQPVPFADLPTIAADSVAGNPTAGIAVLQGMALVNCANGLTYSTSTHTFGCASSPSLTITEPQGRLTLSQGVPVLTTSQSGVATLRYDCYIGGNVPYFTGAADAVDTIASCDVTDAMVSAASAGQVVSGNVYDVWWVHSGANRICLAMSTAVGGGGGWSADTGGTNTSRGTGYTQLDRLTRPYTTNKNSITNCFNGATNYGPVSANQGTYLGTILATANGQTSYIFGTSGSGGVAAQFGIWNMYNRVTTTTTVTDTGAGYSYTSSTVRQARASAGNQIQFVLGLQEDGVGFSNTVRTGLAGVVQAFATHGVGFDSTTAYGQQPTFVQTPAAASINVGGSNAGTWSVGPGLHILSANEAADNVNASTFDSGSGNALTAVIRN